jgi:hypothetical protein
MTAINRAPTNNNLLQATKFLVSFNRMPTTTFFCQSVNLPGVSVGQAPLPFPGIQAYAPGNQLSYNNFNMVFTLDEEMKSWKEIYSWFLSFASPKGSEERNRQTSQQNQYSLAKASSAMKAYSDGTLTVLNALNNPVQRIQFINMFPVSLSDIEFDTKSSADDIVTGDATFVFERFEFI